MRLRASFTVENAVIIPVFTIILLLLMSFTFYLHDLVLVKNALFQTDILAEQAYKKGESTASVLKIQRQTSAYLKDKTMFLTDISISAKENNGKTTSECKARNVLSNISFVGDINKSVVIQESYPPDYIRKVRAAKEVLGEDK
jgi:Flp pilus assembly protein TadG